MVGLLKISNTCVANDKPISGRNFLNFEDFENTSNGVKTDCAISKVCNQNYKRPKMALNHEDCDGSGIKQQQEEAYFHSLNQTNRLKNSVDGKLPKRHRISVTRHRFEPFSSKGGLVNESLDRRFSIPNNKANDNENSMQSSFSLRYGNRTQVPQFTQSNSLHDNAFYKTCYKCCHCLNDNDVIVSRNMFSLIAKDQGQPSTCYDGSALHSEANGSGKQIENREQRNRQNACPSQTEDDVYKVSSNRSSHRTSNASVTGCPVLTKDDSQFAQIDDGEHEKQTGVFGDAKNAGNLSSGANFNEIPTDNRYLIASNANNDNLNSDDLTTLKVFVADEGNECESLMPKRLFMPSNERLKCLKFNPGQYFDIVFEEIQPEELSQLISEVSGKENRTGTGFESANTKENFVNELKSIFRRLPSLEEERLKEEGLYEMILLAKAYFDKYERETKQEQGKDNSECKQVKGSMQSVKKSSDLTQFMEKRPPDKKSKTDCEAMNQGPCYQFVGFEPITNVHVDKSCSANGGAETVLSTVECEDCPADKKTLNSFSDLRCQFEKNKHEFTRTTNELHAFGNKGKLLENSIFKEQKKKTRKKRRRCMLKGRNRYIAEDCRISKNYNHNAPNNLKQIVSLSCDTNEKGAANTSMKKRSVKVDGFTLKGGIGGAGEGSKIERCGTERNGDKNGTGKEDETAMNRKFICSIFQLNLLSTSYFLNLFIALPSSSKTI